MGRACTGTRSAARRPTRDTRDPSAASPASSEVSRSPKGPPTLCLYFPNRRCCCCLCRLTATLAPVLSPPASVDFLPHLPPCTFSQHTCSVIFSMYVLSTFALNSSTVLYIK